MYTETLSGNRHSIWSPLTNRSSQHTTPEWKRQSGDIWRGKLTIEIVHMIILYRAGGERHSCSLVRHGVFVKLPWSRCQHLLYCSTDYLTSEESYWMLYPSVVCRVVAYSSHKMLASLLRKFNCQQAQQYEPYATKSEYMIVYIIFIQYMYIDSHI